MNIYDILQEVYEEALYIEPRYGLPIDTNLHRLMKISFPSICEADFIIDSKNIILPVNSDSIIYPFTEFNYSYFSENEQKIIHSPLVTVW